jgi:predicted phage-related endonuclease
MNAPQAQGKLTPDDQLSGSQLAPLAGASPWASPNDILTTVTNAIMGKPREPLVSEAADWGTALEGLVAMKAMEKLGLTKYQLNHPEAYQHPVLPLACSIDSTAEGNGKVVRHDPDNGIYVMNELGQITLDGTGVVEIKTTATEPVESPPLYMGPIQLQAQMQISGKLTWGAVAILFRGSKLRIFLFEAHQPTLDMIRDLTLEFSKKVEKFKETGELDWYPPTDNKDAQRTWGDRGDEDAPPIELTGATEEIIENLLDAKFEIKRLEEIIDDCEKSLKERLQEHTVGMTPRYKVTWPMRHYKATPERVVPAKPASTIRINTIQIKAIK